MIDFGGRGLPYNILSKQLVKGVRYMNNWTFECYSLDESEVIVE